MPRLTSTIFLLLLAAFPSSAPAQPRPLLGGSFQRGPVLLTPPVFVSGDVNRDGYSDLLGSTGISGSQMSRVGVLPGRGDGTFGDPIDFDAGEQVFAVQVADVDANGTLDLITTGSSFGLTIRLGLGDGRFGPPRSVPIGEDCNYIAVGDIDGDGRPDIVTVGSGSTVHAFLNGGGGDFTAGAAPSIPFGLVFGIAIAKLDPGSFGDLVVASSSGGLDRILTFSSVGGGNFVLKENRAVANDRSGLVVGDFNRDGIEDVATAGGGATQISVLLSKGDDTFQPTVEYRSGGGVVSIASVDYDGDGKADLVALNNNLSVSVLLGSGDGAFRPAMDLPAPALSAFAVSADWNNDGAGDVLFAPSESSGSSQSFLYFGRPPERPGFPGFPPRGEKPGSESCYSTDSPIVSGGDVTGDGLADVVAVDGNGTYVKVYEGHGDGSFDLLRTCSGTFHPVAFQIGDVDADGIGDVVVSSNDGLGGEELITYFGVPASGACRPAFGTGGGRLGFDLQLHDFDGDGLLDVVTVRGADLALWKGRGDGTFLLTDSLLTLPQARYVRVGDLDRDGKADLICLVSEGAVSVFRGLGGFRFAPRTDVSTGGNADAMALGDFDGDGFLDVAVHTSSHVSILRGNGDGTLAPPQPIPAPLQVTREMFAADVDGDGKTDLVCANYPFLDVWRGHGDGTFDLLESDGAAAWANSEMFDTDANGTPDFVTTYMGATGDFCVIPNRSPDPPLLPIDSKVDSTGGHIVITWNGPVAAGVPAKIYRREAGRDWGPRATLLSDASGNWVLADSTGLPGSVYDYRLFLSGRLADTLSVRVPRPSELALAPISPNPSRAPVHLKIDFPGGGARLMVFDSKGRVMLSHLVGEEFGGQKDIEIPESRTWRSGVYHVRLLGLGPVVINERFVLLR